MILDKYRERINLLTEFLEDSIQWGRTNEILMGMSTREMDITDANLIKEIGECFLAKKDILRVEKGLVGLVNTLENGNDSQDFYSSLEERFFNPFTCSPICILYASGQYLIEKSYEYESLKKQAISQTMGVEIEIQEDFLGKIEVINEYEKYLSSIDNVLQMVIEQQDIIDILLYLKQNIL